MNRQIYKYPLRLINLGVKQVVSMPAGAEVLSVQGQTGTPAGTPTGGIQMWALVDPVKELQRRFFLVLGTGHDFDPDNMKYLDTVQDGQYVWHVFEEEA